MKHLNNIARALVFMLIWPAVLIYGTWIVFALAFKIATGDKDIDEQINALGTTKRLYKVK